MDKFIAEEVYDDMRPLDLSEQLNKTGEAVEFNILYLDSPYTGILLKGAGKAIIDTHELANGGNDLQKSHAKTSIATGRAMMKRMVPYANNKSNGSEVIFIELCMAYRNSSTKGGKSSKFSLSQGPNSGQLWISVPKTQKRESYIVMYSLVDNAPLNECMLAGSNTSCRFLLSDLPITTRLFIRWAPVTSQGIGAWSESYPTPVN